MSSSRDLLHPPLLHLLHWLAASLPLAPTWAPYIAGNKKSTPPPQKKKQPRLTNIKGNTLIQ